MHLKWHLRHTTGFLQLGMLADAEAELAAIPPDEALLPEVLALRVALLQEQARWPELRDVAQHLAHHHPQEPAWWITLAYATRRSDSLPAANAILAVAAKLHPDNATIRFNLACYACQLGDLSAARIHLAHAIRLDSSFEALAATDEDLRPLHADDAAPPPV